MNITYHKEVTMPDEALSQINHNHLNQDIKDFIVKRNVVQGNYYIDSNNYYTFIYLNNGDRIDVSNN